MLLDPLHSLSDSTVHPPPLAQMPSILNCWYCTEFAGYVWLPKRPKHSHRNLAFAPQGPPEGWVAGGTLSLELYLILKNVLVSGLKHACNKVLLPLVCLRKCLSRCADCADEHSEWRFLEWFSNLFFLFFLRPGMGPPGWMGSGAQSGAEKRNKNGRIRQRNAMTHGRIELYHHRHGPPPHGYLC